MNPTEMIHRNQEVLRSKLAQKMGALRPPGSKPENTLVVIRHGSTSMNAESDNKVRGWTDIPLSPKGVQEVNDSIPALKKANIDGLITSDLQRAVKTSEIISKELGIPILDKTPNLRSWHLGNLTGKPFDEAYPIMLQYIKQPDTPVPGGESFNQFKERFIREVQKIQAKYPYDKIGIVTHHRGERLLDGWMKAGKPDDVLKVKPEVFDEKGVEPGKFTDYEVPPLK